MEEWQELQEALAREFLVVIYDRAGYGGSETGPVPRDSARESDELRALLDALAVPRPFALVGHSLGGLNAQVYASRYPDDVAGLVLLDPPPLAWTLGEGYPELRALARQMTDEWQGMADAGELSDDAGERAQAGFFRMIASEHREMFGASARQAAAIETLGATPLVVIASGVPNEMFGDVAEEYQGFWIDESRAVAAKADRGEFVLAEHSTHALHRDAADVVLSAIRSVARRGASK
jgi:pimeloyl-ACP methyl ester carboxylesterase